MIHRTLGRTGLRVSEIGFGAWGIGGDMWGPTDERESELALRRALELGIDFFDTAYVYGDGLSERLIARALRDSGRRGLVASKCPPKEMRWPGTSLAASYPADWVVSCTERSLKNLGVETLDVQQFHSWKDEWLEEPAWQDTRRALEDLKRRGKIRFWGVSINNRQPASALKLVDSGLVDSVQVIFNLFEQEPAAELFPLCRKRSVGVIARVPFDEGGLTGTLTKDARFHEDDFRGGYFEGGLLEETVRRADALKGALGPAGVKSLAEGALRFCLSFPEVSTVIPGMRRSAHVEANVAVSGLSHYPEETLARLRAHAWKRDARP